MNAANLGLDTVLYDVFEAEFFSINVVDIESVKVSRYAAILANTKHEVSTICICE